MMMMMVCLHNICRTTASLALLPADDDYDRPTSPSVRFQELAQVWAIAHSLLLDNNIPLHLRDSGHTFLEFRRLLKTQLFCA